MRGNATKEAPASAGLRVSKVNRSSKDELGRTPLDKLGTSIRKALTDDLLKPEYRNAKRPFTGHCYVASEAYYHLKGGKEAGYKACGIEWEGSQHWWLEKDDQIIDLTAEQFEKPVPYHLGKGRGFLTKQPSKRAQTVIDRIK